MKLHMYLSEHRLTRKAFGEKIGYHPAYITQVCNGKKPGKKLMKAISKETNEAVKEEDFLLYQEKSITQTTDLI